jgi:hypothetical protein
VDTTPAHRKKHCWNTKNGKKQKGGGSDGGGGGGGNGGGSGGGGEKEGQKSVWEKGKG